MIGRLAGRCPSGEEAQSENASGVGHRPEAVASYRVPFQRGRLGGLMMASGQDAHFRHPAGGRAHAREVAAYQRDHGTRAWNRHGLPVGRFPDNVSGGAS